MGDNDDYLNSGRTALYPNLDHQEFGSRTPLDVDGYEPCLADDTGYEKLRHVVINQGEQAVQFLKPGKALEAGQADPTHAQMPDLIYSTDAFTLTRKYPNGATESKTQLGTCHVENRLFVYARHPILSKICPDPGKMAVSNYQSVAGSQGLGPGEVVKLASALVGSADPSQSSLFCVTEPDPNRGMKRDFQFEKPSLTNIKTYLDFLKKLRSEQADVALINGFENFISPTKLQYDQMDENTGWPGWFKMLVSTVAGAVIGTGLWFLFMWLKEKKSNPFDNKIFLEKTVTDKAQGFKGVQCKAPESVHKYVRDMVDVFRVKRGLRRLGPTGTNKGYSIDMLICAIVNNQLKELDSEVAKKLPPNTQIKSMSSMNLKGGAGSWKDRKATIQAEVLNLGANGPLLLILEEADAFLEKNAHGEIDQEALEFFRNLLTPLDPETSNPAYKNIFIIIDTSRPHEEDFTQHLPDIFRRTSIVESIPPVVEDLDDFLRSRIERKLDDGFTTLKGKVNFTDSAIRALSVLGIDSKEGSPPSCNGNMLDFFLAYLVKNGISGQVDEGKVVDFIVFRSKKITTPEVRALLDQAKRDPRFLQDRINQAFYAAYQPVQGRVDPLRTGTAAPSNLSEVATAEEKVDPEAEQYALTTLLYLAIAESDPTYSRLGHDEKETRFSNTVGLLRHDGALNPGQEDYAVRVSVQLALRDRVTGFDQLPQSLKQSLFQRSYDSWSGPSNILVRRPGSFKLKGGDGVTLMIEAHVDKVVKERKIEIEAQAGGVRYDLLEPAQAKQQRALRRKFGL